MVWLSDQSLSNIEEMLAQRRREQEMLAAQDAAAMGGTTPYIYEDGSFSTGGSVQGAGYSNPWEPPAPEPWDIDTSYFDYTAQPDYGSFSDNVPQGYQGSGNVIDMRGANDNPWGSDPWNLNANQNFLGAEDAGQFTDWGAVDAAYLGPIDGGYQPPALPVWEPYDQDEALFQHMPETGWDSYDFGSAMDTAYLDTVEASGNTDWMWNYADFGPQQDRAMLQHLDPPANPQDAAQDWVYDAPKIDPANIGSGGTPIWDALDKYVLKPLDYVAELGADTAPIAWGNALAQTAALPYNKFEDWEERVDVPFYDPPDITGSPTPSESILRTQSDLTSPSDAVSDFRDRPFWQQAIYGTLYDPTSVLPVVGFGGEIADIARGARSGFDDLAQAARPGLERIGAELSDEMGAIQIGRVGPLEAGQVVRNTAGQELTVVKPFEGTINGWVTVADEAGATTKIKRGMLDAAPAGAPVEQVDELAEAMPRDTNGLVIGSPEWEQDILSRSELWSRDKQLGSNFERLLTTPEVEETQQALKAVINDRELTGRMRADALDAAKAAAEQAITDSRAAYQSQLRERVLSQARESALKNVPATDQLRDVTKMVPDLPLPANRGKLPVSQIQEPPTTAANPETYINGDRGRYVTTTPDKDGFYDVEMLEGTKKGQIRVTRTAPDGSDPRFAEFQAEWKREQDNFRKIREAEQRQAGQVPGVRAGDETAATPPPRIPPTALADDAAGMGGDWDSALVKIREAARKSENMYRTGRAQDELRAGRADQFSNIRDAIRTGTGSAEDIANAARGSARGKFEISRVQAVDLTPAERNAIILHTNDRIAKGGNPADIFRVVGEDSVLAKITDGRRLQPNEIKWVRENMNPELADSLAKRQPTRGQELAQETKLRTAAAKVEEKQYANAQKEAQRWARRANQLTADAQQGKDVAAMRAKWKAIAAENDAAQIHQTLLNPFVTAEEKAIAQRALDVADRAEQMASRRYSDTAVRQQERAAETATQRANRAERLAAERADLRSPNEAQILEKAKKLIATKTTDPELARQAERSVEMWIDGNRAVLDAIGETRVQAWAKFQSSMTGDVSDSFTTHLLRREEDLSAALKLEGMDQEVAQKLARTLRNRELELRYPGGNMPPAVVRALEEAKNNPLASSQGIAGALGTTSQFLKNSMFWADFSVLGQQVVKAAITSGPQMLVGLANRAAASMNLPHIVTNLAESEGVTKRVAYQLDGVMQGARTGAVDLDRSGSVFSKIPGVGKAADWLTDVQFGTVLTTLRNTIYEGNLITAKMLRQDITDPKVRAAAADYANIATSAGGRALDAKRADWERALLLSPQFTRAQVKQITKLADIIRPGASITQRAMAATTILSTAAVGLGVGKFLNDQYGIGDFQMDPSKPGFGRITFPGGRVVDIFPQDQLVTAIARSARELAGMDQEGLTTAMDTWTKFALGRISPPLQMAAKGGGYGFDAKDGGWKLGDYEGDLLDIAPLPPGFVQVWREGLDAIGTPLNSLGVTNYKESDFQSFDRKVKADPAFGKSYYDLEEAQRKAADEKYRKPLSRDPEIAAEQTIGQKIKDDNMKGQADSDQWLAAGEKPDGFPYTPADWREDRKQRNEVLSAQFDILYRDMPPKREEDKTPVDRYYDAIQAAENADGVVDWDKVDAYMAALPPEDQAYIARNTGLSDTPKEREYRADVAKIGDSGYFDLTEGKREFRQENPEIAALVRKWGYSPTSIAAEDLTNRAAEQQGVDDAALQANTITPEEWRTNYRKRQDQLRAGKDVLYAGLEEDGEPTEPLDKWFAQIDAAQMPNGVDVDWDKVDAWVASQPPEVQAAIDSYTGTALTPLVAEYRADVKVIEASGYWDIRDTVFDYWIQSMGMESGIVKEDAYFDMVREAYVEYAAEYLDGVRPGWRETEPQADDVLAQTAVNSLEAKFQTGVTKSNKQWRDENPDVAWTLRKWGYGGTGKEEVFGALGQEAP